MHENSRLKELYFSSLTSPNFTEVYKGFSMNWNAETKFTYLPAWVTLLFSLALCHYMYRSLSLCTLYLRTLMTVQVSISLSFYFVKRIEV